MGFAPATLLRHRYAFVATILSRRHGRGEKKRNNFQKERSVNMCTNYSITDNNAKIYISIYIYTYGRLQEYREKMPRELLDCRRINAT